MFKHRDYKEINQETFLKKEKAETLNELSQEVIKLRRENEQLKLENEALLKFKEMYAPPCNAMSGSCSI